MVYSSFWFFQSIVAEGAMVCFFCPTATAAAVITSKLGGSAAVLTSSTLIGNIGAAVAVPVLFPLIEVHAEISFLDSFLLILSKVFPLLICPFLTAWLLRRFLPRVHRTLLNYHELAFYSLGCVTGYCYCANTFFSDK